jgi:divalent metal cation (Fe/Co/Zn/Cd) transporter
MNCILAALQTYGATTSLSYSLFATMADALFDPFSNITLWITHRAAKNVDETKYPAVTPHPPQRHRSVRFMKVFGLT